MPLRDIVLVGFILGTLPFILKRPYLGILVWSWIGYMNPHRLTWSFAFDMPFAKIVALTLLVALLMSRAPKRIPVTPLVIVWIMFIFTMGLSSLFAVYPDAAFSQFSKVLKIQFVTFLTLMLIQDKRKINLLIWVIVVSIGFYGFKGGIYTIETAGGGRVWGPPGGFIQGNNELALALLMVIPLMYYLFTQATNRWVRIGLAVSMALSAISVAGSHSRGAFLAGFCIMIFLWLKGRHKLILGVLLVVGAMALLAFMPESWHERMASIQEYEQDSSATGRLNSWETAFNIASARIFGGGFEHWSPLTFHMYAPNPQAVHDAHSIYFEVLGEHGFPGLALFLTIGVMSFWLGGWIIRNAPKSSDWTWCRELARMIQVSLVAYATGGAFLGLAYFDLFYHLIAILILLQLLVKQAAKESTADSSKLTMVSKGSDMQRKPSYQGSVGLMGQRGR